MATATLFLSSFLALSPALASSVEVNVFQGKAIEVARADGRKTEKVVPAASVVPGDTVVYRYIINNNGAAAAENLVVNTKIDPNMKYIEGSATAYGVEFSADGGSAYGGPDDLQVLDIDGTWRDAVADDITNIRWRLKQPVAPGRPVAIGFKAVLK